MESMVVFYPCLNIDETAAFYQEHLGLKLYDDQGKCKIFDTDMDILAFVNMMIMNWPRRPASLLT